MSAVNDFESVVLRHDLQIIASWIEPGSKVLGLGCGEGDLLYFLKNFKQARCTGIDYDEASIATCIRRGLTVLHGNINEEVLDYPDQAFDYVVLSQTLQQIYEPSSLIRSMLRIGNRCVVSFPNFSHWSIRTQLLFKGYAPITEQLPYEWHNTPNIRVITLKDFRRFAKETGFRILKEVALGAGRRRGRAVAVNFMPNLLAAHGIFLIGN